MKIMTRRLFLVILICFASALVTYAQEPSINEYVEGFRTDVGAASVSLALVNEKGITWKGAFGSANIDQNIPATTKHLYGLGSVSKLFTGAAFMKLVEGGKIGLDDDVSRHVPFNVRNPKFPDTPITFRMLLAHTSSIGDYQELQDELYNEGDPTMPLAEVTEKFFSEDGEYFRQENYNDYQPGTAWEYSNWNFVLIGYVVERLSGKPYDQFCREEILEPLAMNNSAWYLKDLDTSKLATLYRQKEAGELSPLVFFSWPGYSDGNLRSNVEEVANYLIMTINGGKFQGKQILKSESIDAMLQPQNLRNLPPGFLKDMGLVWHIMEVNGPVYMHTGEPTGSIIAAVYIPSTKSGFVSFVTGINLQRPGAEQKWVEYLMYLLKHSSVMAEGNAN